MYIVFYVTLSFFVWILLWSLLFYISLFNLFLLIDIFYVEFMMISCVVSNSYVSFYVVQELILLIFLQVKGDIFNILFTLGLFFSFSSINKTLIYTTKIKGTLLYFYLSLLSRFFYFFSPPPLFGTVGDTLSY